MKNCLNCQKEIFGEKRKFCSRKCFHLFCKGKKYEELYGTEKSKKIKELIKSQTINRIKQKNICLYCGKEFYRNYNTKFCGNNCHYKWVKGKTYEELYGEEKAKKIKKILSNVCGKSNRKLRKNKSYKQLFGEKKSELIKEKQSAFKRVFPFSDTSIEIKLKNFLSSQNIPFVPQYPILGISLMFLLNQIFAFLLMDVIGITARYVTRENEENIKTKKLLEH